MLNIYDEISGPAKILRTKSPGQRKYDWHGLPRRLAKQGLLALLVLVAAYGFSIFSHEYIVQSVQVDGTSMAPTLPNAQRYLLNHLVYRFRAPKPSDIVVLRDPEDNGLAVKRIVARPGDAVYVQGGHLFVNGQALPEPYLEEGTKTFASVRYRSQMWICGVDQYFVMGDNRNNSADSRVYGAVPRQNILGMIIP